MASSLEHRKDERTEAVFGHNIKDYTEREHYWSIALKHDFHQRGLSCEVSDHGVDNSGEIIRDKLKNYNADKKFSLTSGKDMLIEVKTAPEWLHAFFTFKTHCLRECLKEGAWVSVPRVPGYHLFKPVAVEKMLANYPHRIYRGFSPNDPAVRIPMGHIHQMIEDNLGLFREWRPKAARYIQENMEILVREKSK